jgi:AcrR family transcriptional regulator
MSKGEQTRERIIEAAALLINRLGYTGMSMSDLMAETGLEKGGLYRHFSSKEEIGAAAFESYIKAVESRLRNSMGGLESPRDRLLAMIQTLASIGWDPVVQGGCMVMNLSIESDYANLPFRAIARRALSRWRSLIRLEVKAAIAAGQLRPDVNSEAIASIVISAIEGAIMLSGIESNPAHARRVSEHLEEFIRVQSP